jgi:adenylate cyclase
MRGLLAELNRRRVFRVAGLYGVVAWIITEVSSVVFPALLLPDWTVTFVVVLLLLGFPPAMILAWVFDVGPQGIERTPPLVITDAQRRSYTWLAYGMMLIVAMAGLGWLLWSRLAPAVPPVYESIAVLPFTNLSGDPANEYFSDGMAEELLNLLAQVPGLQVAARTSSFAFKGQNVDVRELGKLLAVDTVLEGSVRRSGDRVRITAQLVDANSGYHLWSQNYDRQMEDIFAVQDEISAEIVGALKGRLGAGEVAALHDRNVPTDSVEAYTIYLQARHQWKRRGAEPVRNSIELFEQATAIDPGFARAWSGLAAAWVVLPGYAGEPPEDFNAKAIDAARQALAYDPNLAEAHAVLAQVQTHERDWTGAEAGFFFAISLDPQDATSRHWYSLLLARTGRLRDALEQAQAAFALDPASPIINYNLAQQWLALGYEDRAERQLRSAIDLGFDAEQDTSIGIMLALRRGDMERFRDLGSQGLKHAGWDEGILPAVMAAFADRARIPDLEVVLDKAAVPMQERGNIWMLLGEDERAMRALLASADDRASDVVVWYPEGRGVRLHPRFAEFAERAGLLDYWKQFGMPDDCRLIEGRLGCGFATVATVATASGAR